MFRNRAPRPRWPNINVFSDRLNCPKVMFGCGRCSGRLFHSVGTTAVTKLVAWPLAQACSTVGRPTRMAASILQSPKSAKVLLCCRQSTTWKADKSELSNRELCNVKRRHWYLLIYTRSEHGGDSTHWQRVYSVDGHLQHIVMSHSHCPASLSVHPFARLKCRHCKLRPVTNKQLLSKHPYQQLTYNHNHRSTISWVLNSGL